MMYDNAPGPVFRPPSEAYSFILRITLGCSHNQCSFCSMYKGTVFTKRDLSEIFALIDNAAKYDPTIRRVFLADGNALCLPTDELLQILKKLHEAFPKLQRVTSYSAPQDLLEKSVEELKLLKENGLQMVYLGLETGSDLLLKEVRKGATAEEILEGARRIKEAGLKISVMVILGLGGIKQTHEHAIETAKVVSAMAPTYLSALSLMLHPGTELRKKAEQGTFTPLSPYQMMSELVEILENIQTSSPIIFRASHPSNFATFAGTIPKDQKRLIQEAKEAMTALENYQTPEFNDHGRF